jgi:hypothetical protein
VLNDPLPLNAVKAVKPVDGDGADAARLANAKG